MSEKVRQAAQSVLRGETTVWPALAVGLIVALASYAVGRNRGDLEVDVALASMATFLFGVLIAFTIARTTERLAVVQNLLSRGNSSMLSIYQLMAIFPEEDAARVRVLIDRQLTSQIDYRLVDNHLSAPAHLALVATILDLVPQSRQEEVAYKKLTELCVDMAANRALIEATTGQSLSGIEWTGNFLLLLLLLVLLTILPGGTSWGAVASGFLAGTLVTLLVLLRKLDRLRWHERVSIWEPTSRLFRNIGLDPYVPREVIDAGRYRPVGTVRVVDYPDPYPMRTTKQVTVMDLDGKGPIPPRR